MKHKGAETIRPRLIKNQADISKSIGLAHLFYCLF